MIFAVFKKRQHKNMAAGDERNLEQVIGDNTRATIVFPLRFGIKYKTAHPKITMEYHARQQNGSLKTRYCSISLEECTRIHMTDAEMVEYITAKEPALFKNVCRKQMLSLMRRILDNTSGSKREMKTIMKIPTSKTVMEENKDASRTDPPELLRGKWDEVEPIPPANSVSMGVLDIEDQGEKRRKDTAADSSTASPEGGEDGDLKNSDIIGQSYDGGSFEEDEEENDKDTGRNSSDDSVPEEISGSDSSIGSDEENSVVSFDMNEDESEDSDEAWLGSA